MEQSELFKNPETFDKLLQTLIRCGLTKEELFTICRQISEEKLDPDHELYKYFHQEGSA